jgi:hypothetical protein
VIDIVKVHNEGVGISENASAIISLTFELYDRLYIGGTITNSSEIAFSQDTSDPKYITGFAIKVANPSEKKTKSAIEHGEKIVNILSAKTRVAVRSKRPRIERDNTLKISDAPVEQNFDLNASRLSSSLTGKPSRNKKFDSYRRGIAALKENDLENAIRELHKVIEKTKLNTDEFKAIELLAATIE